MSAMMGVLDNASSNLGMMSALSGNREEQAANKIEALRQGGNIQDSDKVEGRVREVAEEFVSVFMNQVMKSMRATVNENPAMHGDNGEKFFQEMLDTEQSKALAKGKGYGLTDLIYESMMASYRVQQPQESAQAQNSLQQEAAESTDHLAVAAIS